MLRVPPKFERSVAKARAARIEAPKARARTVFVLLRVVWWRRRRRDRQVLMASRHSWQVERRRVGHQLRPVEPLRGHLQRGRLGHTFHRQAAVTRRCGLRRSIGFGCLVGVRRRGGVHVRRGRRCHTHFPPARPAWQSLPPPAPLWRHRRLCWRATPRPHVPWARRRRHDRRGGRGVVGVRHRGRAHLPQVAGPPHGRRRAREVEPVHGAGAAEADVRSVERARRLLRGVEGAETYPPAAVGPADLRHPPPAPAPPHAPVLPLARRRGCICVPPPPPRRRRRGRPRGRHCRSRANQLARAPIEQWAMAAPQKPLCVVGRLTAPVFRALLISLNDYSRTKFQPP
jgi:hypothetical protein